MGMQLWLPNAKYGVFVFGNLKTLEIYHLLECVKCATKETTDQFFESWVIV